MEREGDVMECELWGGNEVADREDEALGGVTIRFDMLIWEGKDMEWW